MILTRLPQVLSYTPVPLISFSAEQRQGKQGENDTRIGMELTLQPGHSLQKTARSG